MTAAKKRRLIEAYELVSLAVFSFLVGMLMIKFRYPLATRMLCGAVLGLTWHRIFVLVTGLDHEKITEAIQ